MYTEYVFSFQPWKVVPGTQKEFEDNKGAIRIRQLKKDRQHNGQKGQTTIYKTFT